MFTNSVTIYFNYKGYFSIVIMACVDTGGIFTTIDVGEVGRNNDCAVLQILNFGCALNLSVQLSHCRPLPSRNNENNFFFGMKLFILQNI